MVLHHVLEAARAHAGRPALIEGDGRGRLDYAGLARLSDRVRDRLAALGVGRGDRVGLLLTKSADAVAAIFGVLKAGAAYVPGDPAAPPSRNAFIHHNCGVRAVILERGLAAAYREAWAALGPLPPLVLLEGTGGGAGLQAALDALDAERPAPPVPSADSAPEDLAYILYTSGSTGRPKGVMLTHGDALAFVRWCARMFEPRAADVFSSHAPLHFDLSILDLFVPLGCGAAVVLIPERTGKDPQALAPLIAAHGITVWYSAPSILSLLVQYGNLPRHDLSRLRLVLFAGEVFPVAHLRALVRQLPWPRYFNLYGPTETNVCTWYEIPRPVPEDRAAPYPIGRTCAHLRSRVVDGEGRPVPPGGEGELCIAGGSVMRGYWGLPEQSAAAFLPGEGAERWYRTGDIVVEERDGNYRYVGRRDRMVKRRGYRVELGEIEACLYRHPAVQEAAVVALPDPAAGLRVCAHLGVRGPRRPSLIDLKSFCAKHLPLYMVPDAFRFHQTLPRTSTDKVDYLALQRLP